MKKLYLPIIAAMLAMPAFGETPENMNLTFTYGQNQTKQFALAKKPVVTVDGDNFVIKTTDAQETLPIAEVKTFTFTQLSTGINDVVSSDYAVTVSGGIVTVKGSDVESATVYSTLGTQMLTVKAVNGTAVLGLSSLRHGIYLVAVPGHETVKVKK